ncbi:uncharacterized protein LOC6556975 [Drosophila grimshawi]|uniref:GH16285 n=1 Tax=Drosophila grimshawi TaxID=7222 RepID=B4IY59_DROGR|nr:uncharacterized protein LOC6556975 [Drosophila grimshawi]EDV96509.1 GH16285 [Drosophila grimshawi]
MSLAKFLTLFLISSALLLIANGRPLDDFSIEDDRMNEIGKDFGRKWIMPNLERIFSSAETQTTGKRTEKNTNSIEPSEKETTTSSKHAHGMITSMMSFISSVVNFGRTMIRNE